MRLDHTQKEQFRGLPLFHRIVSLRFCLALFHRFYCLDAPVTSVVSLRVCVRASQVYGHVRICKIISYQQVFEIMIGGSPRL